MSRLTLRGLSLAETVMAIGIIAVALVSLATVFISGLRIVQSSTDLTQATNVGREFLETVKERGYLDTRVGTYNGWTPDPADRTTEFPPPPYPSVERDGGTYTLVVRARNFSSTLRRVDVDVYWDRDSKISFHTMVHE